VIMMIVVMMVVMIMIKNKMMIKGDDQASADGNRGNVR
jgi:hypothetical protein